MNLKTLYAILKLPVRYVEESLEGTMYPKAKAAKLLKDLFKAPTKGTLLISGTAGPVVNHLYDQGRKCVGMSFAEHFSAQFSDEADKPPKGDVVVLYGVGNEAAKSSEYSSKLLISIMDYCKNREVLLIIETPLTVTDFMTKYGIDIPTKLNLRPKQESSWL